MNYKDKINFKIKSTWFDKGVMKNIGYKGFWLYVNLYKFLLGNTNGQVLTTINLLQKETNYSKNEVIKLLRVLRKNKVIGYDNNRYRFSNSNDGIIIDLIDLPQLERVNDEKTNKLIDKPKTDDDFYIVVRFDEAISMIEKGLDERHFLLFLFISKFHNRLSSGCRASCLYMSQKTGLGKNQINNKYLVELEIHRFIVNQFNKSIKGNKQNDIIIIPQDIRDTDSDYREDCFVRNSVNRDRRELMARKIGVTIREEAKYLAMLEYATDEEKKEYYRLKEIHLVFAIKYFYDELYIQLKNRIEEKYVDNIQTSNVDIFGGYYDAKNYKEKKKKVVDIIIEDNIKEIC